MTPDVIMKVVLAFCAAIPTGAIAFFFWLLQRKIDKNAKKDEQERLARQEEIDKRDQKRRENEFMTWQTINASLALSEATAKAVQRIPDAHCNGDMDSALKYANEIKHNQREFMAKAGIDDIYKQQVYAGY